MFSCVGMDACLGGVNDGIEEVSAPAREEASGRPARQVEVTAPAGKLGVSFESSVAGGLVVSVRATSVSRADVTAGDRNGKTAQLLADQRGHTEVVSAAGSEPAPSLLCLPIC